jgi:hypothetical protein
VQRGRLGAGRRCRGRWNSGARGGKHSWGCGHGPDLSRNEGGKTSSAMRLQPPCSSSLDVRLMGTFSVSQSRAPHMQARQAYRDAWAQPQHESAIADTRSVAAGDSTWSKDSALWSRQSSTVPAPHTYAKYSESDSGTNVAKESSPVPTIDVLRQTPVAASSAPSATSSATSAPVVPCHWAEKWREELEERDDVVRWQINGQSVTSAGIHAATQSTAKLASMGIQEVAWHDSRAPTA